jgi:hypothetical protein
MSMTLTDFLLARIAEDEAAAPDGSLWLGGEMPWLLGEGDPPNFPITVDPRRVLAECEAKRRIVDLHQDYGCTAAGTEGHETCGDREWCYTCGEGSSHPCDTLTALALPYADHPDFRDFWLP